MSSIVWFSLVEDITYNIWFLEIDMVDRSSCFPYVCYYVYQNRKDKYLSVWTNKWFTGAGSCWWFGYSRSKIILICTMYNSIQV